MTMMYNLSNATFVQSKDALKNTHISGTKGRHLILQETFFAFYVEYRIKYRVYLFASDMKFFGIHLKQNESKKYHKFLT